MNINVAICDDDAESLLFMTEYLESSSEEISVGIETHTYQNGKIFLEDVIDKNEEIDMVLLDIDMPDITGLDIAKKLRTCKKDILVIFVSAHEQYVFEAIEYNPFRYIRKTKINVEMPLAIRAAFEHIVSTKDKNVVLKSDTESYVVKGNDIMYVEIVSRKTNVHLCDGRILNLRASIKEVMSELDEENYVYAHRSCAINIYYISKFSTYDVTLDNGERLIVSRTRVKELKNKITNYWGKKS